MRLDRLILTGLSDAFPGVVDLPLRDIDEGLVALVGPNGNGKSTVLESTPAAIYRRLPSHDDVDPIEYALGRESSIDLTFSFDGVGAFRSRLNLDGPKRKSDALLEQLQADGTRIPLNDGKVSTYDAIVKARFPSFSLFINSSYAAQGRGDEFTRTKPSARKDLFAEFLGLRELLERAKTAGEAADLASDARLRLQVQIEALERDTAAPLLAEIERQADQLQTQGGDAQVWQRELRTRLDQLQARVDVAADQVAAYALAGERLRALERNRAAREASAVERIATFERDATEKRTAGARLANQRTGNDAALERDRSAILATRDGEVAEARKRIAGNTTIIGMAADITAAVVTLKSVDDDLAQARAVHAESQADLRRAQEALRAVEKELATLAPVEDRRDRAARDSAILESVPCGGAGAYAACQLLTGAIAEKAQLQVLNDRLAPKAALAERAGVHAADVDRLTAAEKTAGAAVTALEQQRPALLEKTKYETALAEAKTKIAGYEAAIRKAGAEADQKVLDRARQRDERDAELVAEIAALDETLAALHRDRTTALAANVDDITRLDVNLVAARAAVDDAAAGNTQAVQLQGELATARAEWDQVTTTLATVTSGRAELERRRTELITKRDRLADVRGRLAQVEQHLVDWQDLAKTLGKGGLPDLEIDAAGPTITATTNELLSACFGPRFSLELVTQVAKADGDGMKDLFTVLVLDNEAPARGWKDLKFLSGGQKVVVQEALMCAIALYVNERSPMPIRTLWRDETGAALDPVNAIAYVHMLRKVRELGRFHHVYFITHNAESAALADAQIRVGGGQAAIVYPPFATSEAA